MFTIEQIKTAHSKVKSGADFPRYVQELKSIGLTKYEHYVVDGNTIYYGQGENTINSGPNYLQVFVSDHSSKQKLEDILKMHQAGKTNYLTFCHDAGESGVEKWIIDFQEMTCIYYDKSGQKLVVEKIPAV